MRWDGGGGRGKCGGGWLVFEMLTKIFSGKSQKNLTFRESRYSCFHHVFVEKTFREKYQNEMIRIPSLS